MEIYEFIFITFIVKTIHSSGRSSNVASVCREMKCFNDYVPQWLLLPSFPRAHAESTDKFYAQ